MAGAGAAFRELLDLLRDADQTFPAGPAPTWTGPVLPKAIAT